ncbi:hypothetical protein [Coleofasciculus sp.]|uniref:hypothetical protein n=1 Tax=Coleofasciculus sp. TaxID=3100458 RepID=UPI003A2B52CA
MDQPWELAQKYWQFECSLSQEMPADKRQGTGIAPCGLASDQYEMINTPCTRGLQILGDPGKTVSPDVGYTTQRLPFYLPLHILHSQP